MSQAMLPYRWKVFIGVTLACCAISLECSSAQGIENHYYCDASRAYYPQVATCATPWRIVQAPAQPEAPAWWLDRLECSNTPCNGDNLSITAVKRFATESECRRSLSKPPARDPWIKWYKVRWLCATAELKSNERILQAQQNVWFENLAAQYGAPAPKGTPTDQIDPYLTLVRHHLAPYLQYPSEVAVFEHGTVVVRFDLKHDGTITKVWIVKSSGHSEFDQAAVAAVRRSSPFPPVPKRYWGRTITMPINFNSNTDSGNTATITN